MKIWKNKIRISALLLAVSFSGATFAGAPNLEDYRREILANRVARVLDARVEAMAKCRSSAEEEAQLLEIRKYRGEFTNYAKSGTPGLVAVLNGYAVTAKMKRAGGDCAKKIGDADGALASAERRKFKGAFIAAGVLNPVPGTLSPIQKIFLELDPWCATATAANFDGSRDTNPCFAGEIPILGALRDAANTSGRTYFESGMKIDQFVQNLAAAVNAKASTIAIESLFPAGTGNREVLAMLTYLYAAGTSELGWVDGFGESFWRTSLDQGASAVTAVGQYLSWLNRKDQFARLRKQIRAAGTPFKLWKREIEGWNHHEVISAFLACNFEARGDDLLARTVPEALGVAYEGKDFVSHIRDKVGLQKSAENFITDVSRHQQGGRFGRIACRPAGARSSTWP
ncbi:MAG: hypothetical protein JST04_03545 [Bdellovibrionales bacterium]|nr:hypothetical protein [Bdellovibrionales bacterium]